MPDAIRKDVDAAPVHSSRRTPCKDNPRHASLKSHHMLFRLIYVSTMTGPMSDLDDIVRHSLKKNPRVGITGGLAVIDGAFLQYLEGEHEEVEALFAAMLHDPRHSNVRVLERRAITQRAFPDWAMARLCWNEETKAIFYSFSPGAQPDVYQIDPSTAAPMFRAWARTSQWQT
ncbi:MAG: BLUF domain-containing protein [Burkholderiaceae bacterium]